MPKTFHWPAWPRAGSLDMKFILSAFLLLLSLTAGCSQTMNRLGLTKADVHHNPHPKQRYELTFTIHDAPGPFDSAEASIQYEVGSSECVPTDPISGAQSKTPGFSQAIPLTRLSENVYQGQIALDLPMNEDYFGLGVCRWMVQSAGIDLKTHGVRFTADIVQADIEAQSVVSTFFPKSSYSESPGYLDGGTDSRYLNSYQKTHSTEFFSVTVESKRITP